MPKFTKLYVVLFYASVKIMLILRFVILIVITLVIIEISFCWLLILKVYFVLFVQIEILGIRLVFEFWYFMFHSYEY